MVGFTIMGNIKLCDKSINIINVTYFGIIEKKKYIIQYKLLLRKLSVKSKLLKRKLIFYAIGDEYYLPKLLTI